MPRNNESGDWLLLGQIIESMHGTYPKLTDDRSTRVKIGQALRVMGCQTKETRQGMKYQLLDNRAA